MARSLYSPYWHSVAQLTPRLVPQAHVSRQMFRGQTWYVVQNRSGGQYYRLSRAAYAVVMGMDGAHTVETLWTRANEQGGEDACTKSEIVDLLVQLNAADLLQTNATPDSAVLFARYKKKRWALVKQWLMNPLSLKFPLLDPEPWLRHWAPRFFWCFSGLGLLLWLMLVVPALVLALQHGRELSASVSDNILSASNLLVMALVYPLVKLLHELGHAIAAKAWGGESHELGVMLLVLVPVPYVDASSSTAFPSKYRRAIVAAAGMMTELVLAAIAMYVWLLSEPGMVRAVAFNTLFIAGVSTLIINGNPLLRYDGYYILCDLIEMPNLAQRGQKYCTYLWDRYVFGVHDLEPPQDSTAEKWWMALYTPLAWCYRLLVVMSIALFIANEFYIFGVLLALWGLLTSLGLPIWKAYKHVTQSPTLQRRRVQATRLSLALLAVGALILFACPWPLTTQAEGVVWLPDQAIVRAGGGGFFQRWVEVPGTRVSQGEPLYVLEDRVLTAELQVARARYQEAVINHRADQFADPAKAALSARKLEEQKDILARIEERAARLMGYADSNGTLVTPKPLDMPGQYYKKGELLGYVLDTSELIARVAVAQGDIDLVRQKFESAEMRLASRVTEIYPLAMLRELTAGVEQLPSAALGLGGGGRIPTLPNDPDGIKTLERVFLIDFRLPAGIPAATFGERVHVRFHHGYEPLALQGLRRLRQLFLSRFGV